MRLNPWKAWKALKQVEALAERAKFGIVSVTALRAALGIEEPLPSFVYREAVIEHSTEDGWRRIQQVVFDGNEVIVNVPAMHPAGTRIVIR